MGEDGVKGKKDDLHIIELIEDVSAGQRGFNRNIDRLSNKYSNDFRKEHAGLAAQSVERAKKNFELEKG